MKRTLCVVRNTILWCVALVAVASVFSCTKLNYEDQNLPVVCIHSYADKGREGEIFRFVMADQFAKHGYSPKVEHIYLNAARRDLEKYTETEWPQQRADLVAFQPKLIMIDDDLALDWIFSLSDSLFKNTPVVYAGVNAPQRDSIAAYPLMCGCEEHISLSMVAEMVNRFTGHRNIVVELDHTDFDERLRPILLSSIGDRTKFIDNSDYAISGYFKDNIPELIGDNRILVSFFSSRNLEENCAPGQDPETGLANSRLMMLNSKFGSTIQVKYDLFSDALVVSSRQPQFTAIHEQFGEGQKFLAGYFTSMESQVCDQVDMAAKVLDGTPPSQIPVFSHVPDYYLDWKVMKKVNPSATLSDYSNGANVINVSLFQKYAGLFILGIVLALAGLAAFILLVVVRYVKQHKMADQSILERLQEERSLRCMALSGAESGFWRISEDCVSIMMPDMDNGSTSPQVNFTFKEFLFLVNEESIESFRILTGPQTIGHHRVRLKIRLYENTEWLWTEWLYDIDHISIEQGRFQGIMYSCEDAMQNEERIRNALNNANEVSLKENFIANISHDIRTPVNAISGFVQLLTSEDCTAEERMLYRDVIQDNSEQLLGLLDSVAQAAADGTGTRSFKPAKVNVKQLMDRCWITNSILTPSHLKANFKPDSDETVCIKVDPMHTAEVVNNFMDNARKYTPSGSITLGWRHLKNEGWVEIYVKDTGVGISEDNRERIMTRFSKVNETDRGTGLGLDICKHIVERQGGVMGFDSTYGEGSTFWFRQPVYKE